MFSELERRWEVADPISSETRERFPELHPITVQLLVNRGITTQEQVDEFLLPDYGQDLHDPFLFRQMVAACERVFESFSRGERVVVHGDYDADGVTGTVILLTALREVAAKAGGDPTLYTYYIPHREKEGYGLHAATVESLAAAGNTLLVTVDCGISNAAEIDLAKERGMDVIVVDHHQVPPRVPDCLLIHPLVPGETYPYGSLAAAGVAFKFATALFAHARGRGLDIPEGREKWLLDLVAIATVTDFMPLVGENRTLEKFGLTVLNKTRRPGLRALIEAAGLERGSLDTVSVGFYIGPRINAASRMEHAELALRTLVSEDEAEARELARLLNLCNADRQRRTEEIAREAREMVIAGAKIQVLYSERWSPGIVGIVAGRLVSELGVPVFVLGREGERIVGSGRSIPKYDVMGLLRLAASTLSRFGGHPEACGLTIEREESLAEFRRIAERHAEELLAGLDLRPALRIECALRASDANWELVRELERLEPHGVGNPRPLFLFRDLRLTGLRPVGKDGKHVRVTVRGDSAGDTVMIGFGMSARMSSFSLGDAIDAVAEVGVNEWNGSRSIQLRLVDVRAVSGNGPSSVVARDNVRGAKFDRTLAS